MPHKTTVKSFAMWAKKYDWKLISEHTWEYAPSVTVSRTQTKMANTSR